MKILLPVDGSEPSCETMAWVAGLFHPQQTQFYVLTVIPRILGEVPVEEYQVEDALAMLNATREYLEKAGYTVVKAEYMMGNPADSICRFAEDENVDQIIIGSHGRTGFSKLLFGSVSAAVFEHAKKPVFIHKNQSKAHSPKPVFQ